MKKIEPKCKNCISGDALIIVDNTVKRINELENCSRTFVENEWQEITAWQKTGKRKLLKITTTLGLELKLTPEHKVATPTGWVEAKNLSIGDEIKTLQKLELNQKDLVSLEDAFFIGAITGDGWIIKNRIPQIIWGSSEKVWGKYLSGLFSTDGCLSCIYKENTTQIKVMFYQTEESLIREMQIMLRIMGIYSYLKCKKRPPYKNLWELTIGRINCINLFQEKIGFIDLDRKNKLINAIEQYDSRPNGRYKKRRIVNTIEKIKKIEELGEEDVFDISVPKSKSFFANGILVHNCLLYERNKGQCKVAILVNGSKIHMPVFPEDNCHMDELGIEVEQVRWWVEDPATGKLADKGIVKIEYPENFFGESNKE